jgi:hypothetical protein
MHLLNQEKPSVGPYRIGIVLGVADDPGVVALSDRLETVSAATVTDRVEMALMDSIHQGPIPMIYK